MPRHEHCADQFVTDMSESFQQLKINKKLAIKGSAAMYGIMAKIPNTIVEDFVLEFFNQMYKD